MFAKYSGMWLIIEMIEQCCWIDIGIHNALNIIIYWSIFLHSTKYNYNFENKSFPTTDYTSYKNADILLNRQQASMKQYKGLLTYLFLSMHIL